MADKYVVVDNCFDQCFKAQVGQYPDNDKDITKDYHLDGPPIHAILLCTKAAVPKSFVFTKPFDQPFVESCSNKSVAAVKGMITAIIVSKPKAPAMMALDAAPGIAKVAAKKRAAGKPAKARKARKIPAKGKTKKRAKRS